MPTVTGKPAVGNGKVTDIATAPVPDTLASLHVDPDCRADARRGGRPITIKISRPLTPAG